MVDCRSCELGTQPVVGLGNATECQAEFVLCHMNLLVYDKPMLTDVNRGVGRRAIPERFVRRASLVQGSVHDRIR